MLDHRICGIYALFYAYLSARELYPKSPKKANAVESEFLNGIVFSYSLFI